MKDSLFNINVSVVIRRGSKFLLAKRSEKDTVFPGHWGIPGGGVEATDKDLEAALNRECIEEIGVSIKNASLVANNIVNRNGKQIIFMVYVAQLNKGVPQPKEDMSAVEWKDLTELKSLKLTPKTLEIIESLSQGIT